MKSRLLVLTCLSILVNAYATNKDPLTTKETQHTIFFTENKGQVYDQYYKTRPDVLYGAMAGNLSFHLRTSGVSYQLYRTDSYKEIEDHKTRHRQKAIDKQTIYRIDLNWINSNRNFVIETDETLPGYNNYYLESCPDGALNVKSYTGVTLKELYNGIDLHYYERNGELKHDYIVAPHANYKQIQIKVEGANITINKDGSLMLSTPLGKIQEGKPIVYQNGKELKSKWVVKNSVLSFEIENYNPEEEIIIDPVTRIWGTYYGGTGNEGGHGTITDALGNVYLVGRTSSTGTVMATVGSHQTTHGGGTDDAFLVKFNGSGVRQWSTYYGGSSNDVAWSCCIDPSGNICVTGQTASNSGTTIATVGSHQPSYTGGVNDAFLVKFNSAGIRQWGTYYGGAESDEGIFCTTDAAGNIYVTGSTTGNYFTFIATAGSHQTIHGGGTTRDAFLVKFNSSGVRQWGTYYGGSLDDIANSCSIDPFGNVYITGYTNSNSGTSIATVGSHQPAHAGGLGGDAFLVKFNSSGVRQWGTYYGGNSIEYGYSCICDATGNVFIAGQTSSSTGTVIATLGSHQSTLAGSSDNYLAKFNGAGARLWGTYYGGISSEEHGLCNVDAAGNVCLVGRTNSSTGTFIATAGSHQTIFGGGAFDVYLASFNSSGIRLWGTYYGGALLDASWSCAIDLVGNIYISGETNTSSGTSIATPSSFQSTYGGGSWEAFLVKFNDCTILNPTASVNSTVCSGSSLNFTATITGTATPTYSWAGPASYTSTLQNPVIANASISNAGTYTLTVNNGGCVEIVTTQVISVNPLPTITVNSGSICSGSSFTINPSGANTYTIQGGSSIVSPTTNASYTVIGTSTAGCISSNTATSNIAVNSLPSIVAATSNSIICVGQTAILTASGALTYSWSNSGTGSSISVSPSVTTVYTVTGINANGCSNITLLTQSVSACAGISSEQEENEIQIYPNPTTDYLYFKLNNPSPSTTIQITNSLGQILLTEEVKEEKYKINIETLLSGVYFVKSYSTKLNSVIKIMKK